MFAWLDENKRPKNVTSERQEYKEDHSLEFSGEVVHKGLGPASLLPMGPAKHDISGYNKASDPASTLTFPFLAAQLSSSVSIAHFHETSSILSVIPMKLLLALYALLVIASTKALAAPSPVAAAEVEAFCNSPGQPCHKIKRIAAALAEPVASAEADPGRRPWCWLPGQYCLKKKRDAAANASPWCRFPGQYCLKDKRDAAATALPWCRLPGQACSHAKRQLDELEVVLKAM